MSGESRAWRKLRWRHRNQIEADLWHGYTAEDVDHAVVAWRIGRLRKSILLSRVLIPVLAIAIVVLALVVDEAAWGAIGGPIGATLGGWRKFGPSAHSRLDAAERANGPQAVAAASRRRSGQPVLGDTA